MMDFAALARQEVEKVKEKKKRRKHSEKEKRGSSAHAERAVRKRSTKPALSDVVSMASRRSGASVKRRSRRRSATRSGSRSRSRSRSRSATRRRHHSRRSVHASVAGLAPEATGVTVTPAAAVTVHEGSAAAQPAGEQEAAAAAAAPRPSLRRSVPSTCAQHEAQPLTLYCESCSQPACQACRTVGAHAGLSHICTPVAEACRTRLGLMHRHVQSSLMLRRSSLGQRMAQLEQMIARVASASAQIQQESRIEQAGMLQRLARAEAEKTSVLAQQLSQMRQVFQQLSDFITAATVDLPRPDVLPEALAFLEQYPATSAQAELLQAVPLPDLAIAEAVTPDDLPREAADRVAALQKTKLLQQELRTTQMMVQQLLQERAGILARQTALIESHQREVQQWDQLTARYEAPLAMLQHQCVACGGLLLPDVVNAACHADPELLANATMRGIHVPADVLQAQRHMFLPPPAAHAPDAAVEASVSFAEA